MLTLRSCVVVPALLFLTLRLSADSPAAAQHARLVPVRLQDSSPPEDPDAAQRPAPENQPERRQIPTLPETVVPARPEPFPARPLNDDTIVTATRTELAANQTGSSITVIRGDQLRERGHTNAMEALRGVAGLDAVRQGGPGGLSSVFLRGANSQHTKVLLDGIPINDPSNATRGFDFSTLTVDNIERIEVLRGPQSVLYGSDAIGGVINIVTRRGSGPLAVQASGGGGSFGTAQTNLGISGGNDRYYYSLTGSYLDTAGISSASRRRGFQERDGYDNATASGRFGWTPAELLNLDYVFRFSDVDAEVDDFDFGTGLPADNLIRRNLSRAFYQRVQAQSLLLDGTIEQTIGFSHTDYDRRDTDSGPFSPPQFRGQTRLVDYQADLLLTETNVFTVGASYLDEQALSSFVARQSQNNAAVFVQDQFQVGQRWFATAGARWDDHNQAGPASTYRVTNVVRFDETGTAFHGSLGTGFRAPALAENLFEFGNPNLRPERSKGWDAGVEQQWLAGQFILDVTYFRNDIRDLIVFDFNTFSLQNIGQARASGVEVTGLWNLDACRTLGFNYTLTDTLDLDTGQPLLRRPRDKASLFAERRWGCHARARVEFLYVGDRLDTRSAILDQYLLFNASGSYDLTRTLTIYARLENLLDEHYAEVNGYGAPGISAYAGLRWNW